MIQTKFEYEMTERLVRALEQIAEELSYLNKLKEKDHEVQSETDTNAE